MRVEVRIEGTPSELPAGLDLSAYRIVQEALTNVVRHAGPATARVTVRHSSGQVAVEVVDDGGGAAKGMESAVGRRSDDSDRPDGAGRSAGHGIAGMRERAALYRGTLEAGPLPGGGFRVLVESAPDLEVVGEAGDGAEAVELARRERPDVVLMDIRMPRMDGLEATRRIVALDQAGGVRVLVLTTFDLDEYVYEALRAGASGFLSRTHPRTTCWPPSGSWPQGTRYSPQHHPPAGDAGLRDGPDHPRPRRRPARSVGVPTFREETRHDGDQGAELSKRFGDVLAVDQLDFEIDQETVAGYGLVLALLGDRLLVRRDLT